MPDFSGTLISRCCFWKYIIPSIPGIVPAIGQELCFKKQHYESIVLSKPDINKNSCLNSRCSTCNN